MLICDLCGGKEDIKPTQLNFEICRIGLNEQPIITTYSKDICIKCYLRIFDMINEEKSPSLDCVLTKGLDLKQDTVREPYIL